jgi:Cu2+-exporting ATPase
VVDRSLLETKADFFFMGQSLRFLPGLLGLAKRRQLVVRVAFTFALGYNLTAVGICLQGLMSPLLAAVLMPLSSAISLAIVAVGLRGRNQGDGKVALAESNRYDDGAGSTLPAIPHEPRTDRLRPRSV